MSNVLHVLNGDATLHSFERTGIDGDLLVWREVLSEGPLLENIISAGFWNNRATWIGENFGETAEGYQQKVVEPLSKLNADYDEVDLWFEFDLHCQVNMLGVMMMLSQHTDLNERSIYLICPDSFPNKPGFRGMGELTGDELEYLYDNIRVQLSAYDFELATEAWDVYIAKDAALLQNWLATERFWGNLHSLQAALNAHLKRLHTDANGHNYIEQKLMEIYNRGIKNRSSIHQEFWKEEPIYGMGDLELNTYLDKLGIS